jgi:tetratricopeptide (TPR) repeat protein
VRDATTNYSDIRQMFGATHLVSGRVRRAGSKLRLSIELVDCKTGVQLWAGRYDKTLDDLFEVQDDVTRNVVAGIEPALEDSEMRRTLGRPAENLVAYELLHRGYWHLYKGSEQDKDDAWRCFEAALARDSTYAGALVALGIVKYREAHANPVRNFDERMEHCRDATARALELDPQDPRALKYHGSASCFLGDQDTALGAMTRSIDLCPNYATAYSGLAFVYDFRGNFADAMPAVDETIRLRPHDPVLHKCIMAKAIAHYQTGQYGRAERVTRDSFRTNNTWWLSNMLLAASLAQRGHIADARVAAQTIRADQPGITLEIMLQRMPFDSPAHSDHLAEGLIRAGWRDG